MLQKNGQVNKWYFWWDLLIFEFIAIAPRCVLGEVQGLCINPRKSVQIMGVK